MKFQITEGLNLLSIGICETGNYLRYKKPLSVVWYDHGGSLAKYLCIMPYNQEYKAAIRKNIVENLYVDYTNRLEELHQLLSPLLKLFPNGTYELKYHKAGEGEFFKKRATVEYAPNEFYTFCNDSCSDLKIADATIVEDLDQEVKKHNERKTERGGREQWGERIIDYTSYGFYEAKNTPLIATQPLASIDQDRVKFFEGEIQQGKQPFIIVYNCHHFCFSYNDFESDHFVLDGHHKLIAYQNLGKLPVIVEITHLPASKVELEFDLELLSEVLFSWQFEHIKQHCG